MFLACAEGCACNRMPHMPKPASSFIFLFSAWSACSFKWYGVELCWTLTGLMSLFICSLTLWFLSLPNPEKFSGYLVRQSCSSCDFHSSIIHIGWKVSGVELNCLMPSFWSADQERIGLQNPDMMCHTTGTENFPKDTAHRAWQLYMKIWLWIGWHYKLILLLLPCQYFFFFCFSYVFG